MKKCFWVWAACCILLIVTGEVLLNVAWVVGSYIILFTNWASLTNAGWWAVAVVADIVTIFAVVQYVGLRRLN